MIIDDVRRLNIEQINILHKKYMKRDFPANELRPFSMIKRMLKKEQYVVYGAYSDNKLVGYCCFLLSGNSGIALLDYFAVQEGMRGCGIGSKLFCSIAGLIKKEYKHTQVILIECETPEKAKNNNERLIREKRIRFYEKNGAYVTDYCWCAFNVEYNLLALPVSENNFNNVDFGKEVYNMYLSCFGFLFRFPAKKKLKYWKNNKTMKL